MEVVRQYKTKAKWQMYADAAGLPYLGYDGDYWFKRALAEGKYTLVPEKTNILLRGAMMLTGTARGRSAAHFNLKAPDGWVAHMTMVGTASLFHTVSTGAMTIRHETWEVPEPVWDGAAGICVPATATYSGAVVTGYWTVAKQGTEVSIIPAPNDILSDQERKRD